MMKICFSEEDDSDFIRWASNLFRTFVQEGSISFVRQIDSPDAMIAGVWRKHEFPPDLPVILVSNENWRLFKPYSPLRKYKAVLGLYPPSEPCSFIQFPYIAVHYDVPIEELYKLRKELLNETKTRFCCFVTSGTIGELSAERIGLFNLLNRWKRVHSAGQVANNVNYRAPRGLDFLRWISRFRFMICLENSMEPNYITEKPFQPWFAGTVPIYGGGCANQLNQDAIVNAFSSDALLQLQVLEAQPDLYERKRRADLCERPISLTSFEQQFRELMMNSGLL